MDLGELPDGVIVAELGAALSDHEALVRERLYGLVGFDERPGALNAARWDGGTFVYVPRGVEVDLPVESILSATGAAGRVFGRSLVVVEEGAKAHGHRPLRAPPTSRARCRRRRWSSSTWARAPSWSTSR